MTTNPRINADRQGWADGHAGRYPVPPLGELREVYLRGYTAGRIAARQELPVRSGSEFGVTRGRRAGLEVGNKV